MQLPEPVIGTSGRFADRRRRTARWVLGRQAEEMEALEESEESAGSEGEDGADSLSSSEESAGEATSDAQPLKEVASSSSVPTSIMVDDGLRGESPRDILFKLKAKARRRRGPNPEAPPHKPVVAPYDDLRNWSAPAYAWSRKEPFDRSRKGSVNSVAASMKELPSVPKPAMLRQQSTSIRNVPAVIAVRGSTADDPKIPSTENKASSFLDLETPPMRESLIPAPLQISHPAHSRNISATSSSPVLPLQTQRKSKSTVSSDNEDTDKFQPLMYGVQHPAVPKVSRFSWTNSQAPQTPRDARYSSSTTRSSVPRFRTIESWVNQQTGRIEDQRFREQLMKYGEQEPVPNVPKQYKHNTSASDATATVFRYHPGTEVAVPRGSLVPSEILNDKLKPHEL